MGRDQELDRLELQILKAVNGEGSVINVVGEAGIGKSRLMAELKKREVMKRVMLLEGRAISMGKNLSFYPVIDLLKNWARIREDDGEASAMAKLQEAIRQVSAEEVDEIFPFVATLIGLKLSGKHAERIKGIEGEALEKLIFKNVRELLIRSTEIIPNGDRDRRSALGGHQFTNPDRCALSAGMHPESRVYQCIPPRILG